MPVCPIPRESYYRSNYRILHYDLSKLTDVFYVVGNWIDIYEYPPNINLNDVFIRFNDSFRIPLSSLPITTPFSKIELINHSEVTEGTVTLLISEGLFKKEKQIVEIDKDREKYADFVVLEVVIEQANGGYPPPVQVSNDSRYRDTVVLIADKDNTDIVWVGNSPDNCIIPLYPGASMSITKTSLNKIYVVSSTPGQTVYVFTGGA
ncbi:MAG: hypothetical protein QXD16_04810 [Sulfolobales archaeon]